MLTGRRAFEGDDVSDTLARVLMKEPDWTRAARRSPACGRRRVLRRCLQKDPQAAHARHRRCVAWRSTARFTPPRRRRHQCHIVDVTLAAWLGASRPCCGLALASLAFVHFREAPAELRRMHLSVPLSAMRAARQLRALA